MDYQEFVNKVIQQDDRNIFSEYSGPLDACIGSSAEFYQRYNPVDVEFEHGNGIIRMVPAEELEDVRKEYAYLAPDMVFAICNGDPIFVKEQVVFTCLHGARKVRLEQLADSFDAYLSSLSNQI